MIDQNPEELALLGDPAHMARVRESLRAAFPDWFHRFVAEELTGGVRFARKHKRGVLRARAAAEAGRDPAARLAQITREAAEDYQRSARPYLELLDSEVLGEYGRPEMRIFADDFSKRLPVINKALNGPLEEMTWWKKKYRTLARTHPEQIHDLAVQLVEFAHESALGQEVTEFLGVRSDLREATSTTSDGEVGDSLPCCCRFRPRFFIWG